MLLCMQASNASLGEMQQLVLRHTGILLDHQYVTVEDEIAQ